jgi:F-type H+-transporting ATPase subunit a
MGEHQTWLDYLDQTSWAHGIKQRLAEFDHGWLGGFHKMMGAENRVVNTTLVHVFGALLVVVIALYGALRFRAAVVGQGNAGLVPPPKFTMRHFVEIFLDAVWSIVSGALPDKPARKFFPLIAALALFIFFSNVLALVPGMPVITTSLKTNLALSLIVFFTTHIYGIKEHGVFAYLKQFTGGTGFPLFLLMVPIELISHFVRPISLAFRLMGNMVADHKVVFTCFTLVPLVIPLPFLFLGLLVCVIQTLVFCLLSTVYISMAIAHDH